MTLHFQTTVIYGSLKDIIHDILTKVFIIRSRSKQGILGSFCSVVVITCALHAQGPRLKPGRNHLRKFFWNQISVSLFHLSFGTDFSLLMK